MTCCHSPSKKKKKKKKKKIKYEIRNLPVSIVPTKGRAKIEKNNYLKND